jgi:hypothetical protein
MSDVVFSFDTTGSMAACLAQVRKNVQSTIKTLFRDVPNLRVGIIAHGDYCDAPPDGPYVIRMLDLTTDQKEILKFVGETPSTFGGDADECYELVLHEARRFTWRAGVPRVLAMIGDANPHEKTYALNEKKLDWKNELDLLTEASIKVYGVQALNRRESTAFYKEVAMRTKGFHLQLDQFSDVEQLIMAVCYKQESDDALKKYVDLVQAAGKINRSTSQMYGTLLGKEPVMSFKKVDLAAVMPGRFQVLEVDKDATIRDFVEDNGAVFKKGRGFYQFTKTENVQASKEVVLVDKKTGDMYSGDKAREMLGAPPGVAVRVRPGEGDLKGYDAFIQSTSVNRRLVGGTKFLYEVADV